MRTMIVGAGKGGKGGMMNNMPRNMKGGLGNMNPHNMQMNAAQMARMLPPNVRPCSTLSRFSRTSSRNELQTFNLFLLRSSLPESQRWSADRSRPQRCSLSHVGGPGCRCTGQQGHSCVACCSPTSQGCMQHMLPQCAGDGIHTWPARCRHPNPDPCG